MEAFVEGVFAGLGIALPVGAAALLIMDLGARRGFAPAFAAGAGASTSQMIHAVAAAIVAAILATFIERNADLVLLLGGLALVIYGLVGLYRFRTRPEPEVRPEDRGEAGTYFIYLYLTITNATSLVYFLALIVGRSADVLAGGGAKVAFLLGAGSASFGWHAVISSYSSATNRFLPATVRVLTRLLGSLIVVLIGVRFLLDVF
jgi:arginine exporter protein ArgO